MCYLSEDILVSRTRRKNGIAKSNKKILEEEINNNERESIQEFLKRMIQKKYREEILCY